MKVFIFSLLMFFCFFAGNARAIDMATAGNYNIRFDGGVSWDSLGARVYTGDLDNDGLSDLVVTTNNSSDSELYIIFNSLISKTAVGNNIDLSDTDNYNLRYYGQYSLSSVVIADIDSDGNNDLLVGDKNATYNGKTRSGAVYLINNDLINKSAIGVSLALTDSANYNLRYEGEVADSFLGSNMAVADIDGDDDLDLLLAAQRSWSYTGSIYLIFNTNINKVAEGLSVNLATSTNYNIRYDGDNTGGSEPELGSALAYGDIDDDGATDMLFGGYYMTYAANTGAGAVYLINNDLVNKSAVGTTVSLATSTNYSIRYGGGAAYDYLGLSLNMADIDSDGAVDLLMGAGDASYNSRSGSGSFYIIYNTLINKAAVGADVPLATSTNYNLRYDGVAANNYFSDNYLLTADLDNDGKSEIIVNSYGSSFNSRADSGSVFVINNDQISKSAEGTNVDMATASNYQRRYDGALAGHHLGSSIALGDLDNDDVLDLLIGADSADYNSQSDSGSLYTIYNYPHIISLTASSVPDSADADFSATGSVGATSSTTTISGVQYQLDSSSVGGTWTTCTATDGDFDSTSEDYSCNVTISSLTAGSHSVYLRSYDTNQVYTLLSNYPTDSFLITASDSGDSSNNSSSNSSPASSPVCGDSKPANAPNLFQIDASNSQAKLFFTPISNTDVYYVSFSTNQNAEEHGGQVKLLREGVQSHSIYLLKPYTTYYFKVRGQNGCMPGDWSNIMKITTRPSILSPAAIFYKNSNTNTVSRTASSPKYIPTPFPTPVPEAVSSVLTPSPTFPVSLPSLPPKPVAPKFCFLWWCW